LAEENSASVGMFGISGLSVMRGTPRRSMYGAGGVRTERIVHFGRGRESASHASVMVHPGIYAMGPTTFSDRSSAARFKIISGA
jgi:hypothetical protein